ncbi:MAG: phosphomannomutase, partial [Candidatus Zixiibacteriota bacterium]
MEIFEKIFRAYDIRGIYGKDLTEEVAEEIGKAFGTYIGLGKNLLVGRDVRLSGEKLQTALTKGLLSTGCHVKDLGIIPTPAFYFAIAHYAKDGGVIVTASHNPPEWNGFKLCREEGIICAEGTGMEEIKEIALSRSYRSASSGKLEKYDDNLEDYTNFVLDKVKIEKNLKVAVDLSNGVCSLIVPRLFRMAGAEVVAINAEPDGTFPAHRPEPTEETLKELKKVVMKEEADFGVG